MDRRADSGHRLSSAPAWPGTGLPSLSGPSPQAAERCVPALEPSSPARRAPAGGALRGRLSVPLRPGCCAAGASGQGRAGSAAPWPRGTGSARLLPASPGAQSTTKHRPAGCPSGIPQAGQGTAAPGCWRWDQRFTRRPNQHRICQSTGSVRSRQPKRRRNPQPTGAWGRARCRQRRIIPMKSSPGLGPAPDPRRPSGAEESRGPGLNPELGLLRGLQ